MRIVPSSVRASSRSECCASLCRRTGAPHLDMSSGTDVSHAPRSTVVLWSVPQGQDTNVRDLDSDLNALDKSRDLEYGLQSTKTNARSDDRVIRTKSSLT